MANDWEVVHFRALRCVKKDQGIKYYRRCGVIAANHMMTTKEQEDEEMEQMVMISIILCLIILTQTRKRKRNE